MPGDSDKSQVSGPESNSLAIFRTHFYPNRAVQVVVDLRNRLSMPTSNGEIECDAASGNE